MAINSGQVTLDEAATIDKRLQTVTRTIGDEVHIEVMCLIDPDDASGTSMVRILAVQPALTDLGMVVRPLVQDRFASDLHTSTGSTTVSSQGSGGRSR